ncbi:DMT family transporter [Piscinibacter sakaiensis]|uniref:DMT family transporter n=1 Tax=Piscinibacter sakaiensis TaxID=1547922 RepID=UPI003AAC8C36
MAPMTPVTRRRLALAVLWLVPALWSSNYVIARASVDAISPHLLALGRWSLAFVIMLPLTWRALVLGWPQWRGEWPRMLLLGALGMWICGAFVYIGARSTSVANMGLIYAATPVVVALLGARLLREPVGAAQRWGMALALSGVLFVITKGRPAELLAVRFVAGDLWLLAAAAAWVGYSLLLQRWTSALDNVARLAAIVAGGIVVLLPFTLIELLASSAPALAQPGKGLLLVVLAAVLPGVISYQAYSFLLHELGAARAVLVLYLAPIYGALSAWLVLGEPPRWYHAVGAAIILPSIWLATRKR